METKTDMMADQAAMAAEVLRQGGLILYPTDTVWGLGCDATNAAAVDKLRSLKGAKVKNGLIVLVRNVDAAAALSRTAPSIAWELFEVSNTPLTLILPDGCGVAENVLAEDGSVAIRIADSDFCRALFRKFQRPVVSTSANFAGKPTPANYGDIDKKLIASVDFSADPSCGRGNAGQPSSIIKIGRTGEINIIRE